MANTLQVFRADFAKAFAAELGANDSAVLNQLAPHYATLAKAYDVVAGRKVKVTEAEIDAATNEVVQIINSDQNLAMAFQFFAVFPQTMATSGAQVTSQDLATLVNEYAQALTLLAQDPNLFPGEASTFVTTIASALQNAPVSGGRVDAGKFFQSVSDVVLFKSPDLPEEEPTSEEPASTTNGIAV